MKAFVGHSFLEKDYELVNKIIKFCDSAGLIYLTGERAENSSIAEKVKQRIQDSDIFIGIFTRDEEVLINKKENLNTAINSWYTTSSWVIQESGFAIGKNKELIFLVENGIYKFPELQGDMEVIYFDRQSLDEAFIKLNQIISSVKDKKIKGVAGEVQDKPEELERQENGKAIERVRVKEVIEDEKEEAFVRLHAAIFIEDYKQIQEIYDKELQKILSDNEKTYWKAIILRLSHRFGGIKGFEKLLKHVEENEDNPDVIFQLALRYREMEEYQKAKDKFLVARDLYDANTKEDIESMILCCKNASICIALDGKYDDAIDLLSELLLNNAFEQHKSKILASLAEIAKMNEDAERFFVYAEGSLNLDPSNTGLRFDLAYRYSQKEHNKLSLLHYKKLINTRKSPVGLNNLGVQYQTLKLPVKSIESYSKAAEDNETLAMANIAQRYLNEGFAKDAEKELKRANDLSKDGIEVHGNVGYAKNRLTNMLEDEGSKEKEILIEAEKEREFRVKYSEAFYCGIKVNKEKLEGIWKTPRGDLEFIFLDEAKNLFKVEGKEKVKAEGLEVFLKERLEPNREHFKNRLTSIYGNIENLSARYKIEIVDIVEYERLTPERKTVYEASGYMVISESYSTIDVMEKTKEEKLIIETWEKKVV